MEPHSLSDRRWAPLAAMASTVLRFVRIADLEARSEYGETRLGILWLPITTLAFSGLLALVFKHTTEMSQIDFFLYVLVGYSLWSFISSSVTGSVAILQKTLDFAVHNNLSLLGLFAKHLTDRAYAYLINVAVLLVIVVLFDTARVGWQFLLFVPFLGLILLTSLAVSYIVNLLTLIFPDLSPMISTAMRLLFFAAPVFWTSANGASPIQHLLLNYNPAAYYLTLARQVFGVAPLEAETWLLAGGVSAALAVIAAIAYLRTSGFVRNVK